MGTAEQSIAADLSARVKTLLDEHDPAHTSPQDFLAARFDAGLAWVQFPRGCGGLDLPPSLQAHVDAELTAAGAPPVDAGRNGIGLGMVAPVISEFCSDEQKRKFLRPLFIGEHIYCELFSEPAAGSDLAGLATRAVRDGSAENADWIINGQKVWTSSAHLAQMAILVARTDPAVPKHQGLTYFLCDMTDPGVEVRPLRQITGEAEFNEVFLSDVRVPDANRLGPEGGGWRLATATLNTERVAIAAMGGTAREAGMIGRVTEAWRNEPGLRNPAMHDELMRLWVEADVARLTGARLRQQLTAGQPGPEGAGLKVTFARVAQAISGFEMELRAESGLRYDDWALRRPDRVDLTGRGPGYRYLRARGNSIEGGTSEILRNTIAERILGLPGEHRVDKDVAWKELSR
jgi:alkylation response protein AidB-like acyl-CoA dehydrogenase